MRLFFLSRSDLTGCYLTKNQGLVVESETSPSMQSQGRLEKQPCGSGWVTVRSRVKPSATVPRKQQSGLGSVREVRFDLKRVAGRRPPTRFNRNRLTLCDVTGCFLGSRLF